MHDEGHAATGDARGEPSPDAGDSLAIRSLSGRSLDPEVDDGRGAASRKPESLPPAALVGRVIQRSIPCVRCRYQLRGLPLGGSCPECGDMVAETVTAVLDPEAADLPRLRRPRSVGNGILATTTCMAAAMLLTTSRPFLARLELVMGTAAGSLRSFAPRWVFIVATACALVAALCVSLLAPPRAEREDLAPVRSARRLRIGLLGMAAAASAAWGLDLTAPLTTSSRVILLGMAIALTLALLALRELYAIIGDRSRQYRTAGPRRQGLRDMVVAVGGVVIGDLTVLAGGALGVGMLEFVGILIAWVSIFMLLVGFAYLVVNALWIRHALVSPPPSLDELLAPETPAVPPDGTAASEEVQDASPPGEASSGNAPDRT